MIQNGCLKICLGVFFQTFFVFVQPEPWGKNHSKLTCIIFFRWVGETQPPTSCGDWRFLVSRTWWEKAHQVSAERASAWSWASQMGTFFHGEASQPTTYLPGNKAFIMHYLGGGNSNICYFYPRTLGKWSIFDEHIFQMGWFNHQLVMVH